ncbi:MAG: rhomboid family intramembrane serine protease [Oscillospiraceae bacterium]|nr:rhomboid family intramembrane serine protease [Oscillospiraceae bacterium]
MKKVLSKFDYNSPVVITFTLIAFAVQLISSIPGTGAFHSLFVASRGSFLNPLFYVRLFTHVIGHGSWGHFAGNFSYILILGPMLEEKYGSKRLTFMMLITALLTSVIHIVFSGVGLCGASGIVFMFILLASCGNIREGKIPVTLILAGAAYIGKELIDSIGHDQVSQLSHILGGITGAAFGFLFAPKENEKIIPY